jgi:dienelactone hydrolase
MVSLVLAVPLAAGRNAHGEDDGEAAEGPPEAEIVELLPSDGLAVTAWYYPPWAGSEEEPPKGVTPVIVVHDLLGSHESIEPLALALQQKGMAVIAPDLRGHGESRRRADSSTKENLDAGQFRKADLEAIAAVAGGTVREPAAVQGDLEVVRRWLADKAEDGSIDMKKLCVVGSGMGATLAAYWVANDWAWGERPLASGPQGRFVRGLVLVSPVWSGKGVSLTPALASPAMRGGVPLLLIAGSADRDAARLFDQLKRFQPDSWFEQKAGQEPKSAPQLGKPADADLFSIQLATPLSADKILADPTVSPAERIAGFIGLATSRRGK